MVKSKEKEQYGEPGRRIRRQDGSLDKEATEKQKKHEKGWKVLEK